MKKFMSLINRISLTTDLWWSSEQRIGYMTVTGHLIDSKWQLHKRVLSFKNVPPPHSGEVLCREFINVVDDWGIRDKVVSISVDNASANDNCIVKSKRDYSGRRNLPLNGKLFHVRCCAHILNLLVQDGFDMIKLTVDKIRNGIKYLLNSETRCKVFKKFVDELQLEGRMQVLDTKTRWNSTWVKVLLDKPSSISNNPQLQALANEMKLKYDNYWSESNTLISIGAVLDPRYKMIFIKWVYPFLYSNSTQATAYEQELATNLNSLFQLYQDTYGTNGENVPGSETPEVGSSSGLGRRSFEMFLETVVGNTNSKFDLELYLEEPPLKVLPKTKFDVLTWGMKPIVIVASEAIFSTGKRVIDPKRSSMKTKTIEMVLCGGDWVKEKYGIKKGCTASILGEPQDEPLAYHFGEDPVVASSITTT
ncbi:zinc finger BED domain-containing protein RICESLEEPER 2-like [Vicia villosa]|uniref:zinc finger BED domain-containing protein RICESLEEPER 2-like n=1 Tax=Vicia villosa TaxID=3911 RepID=UPI00273C6037|nr:zinc finger BED domain-containing protein RICESLEEPER 2-like [Vicia villosa]